MGVLLNRYLIASAVLLFIWILMVGSLHWHELLAGLLAAMAVSYLALSRLRLIDDLLFSLAFPWHLLNYLLVFSRALIEANLDMAKRVVSPALPIHPTLVEFHTRLRSPLGRLLLANSITLTPGTLTVEVNDDRLRVHWIDDRQAADLEQATRIIAERFETSLGRFVR